MNIEMNPDIKRITPYFVWFFLVLVNTFVCVMFAESAVTADVSLLTLWVLNIVCICTVFVPLFVWIEQRYNRKVTDFKMCARLAAVILALTQLFPILQIFAGMIALGLVGVFTQPMSWFAVAFTIILTGLSLMIVWAVFLLILLALARFVKRCFGTKKND